MLYAVRENYKKGSIKAHAKHCIQVHAFPLLSIFKLMIEIDVTLVLC